MSHSLSAVITRRLMHRFWHNFTWVKSQIFFCSRLVSPSYPNEATHLNRIWTPGVPIIGQRLAQTWRSPLNIDNHCHTGSPWLLVMLSVRRSRHFPVCRNQSASKATGDENRRKNVALFDSRKLGDRWRNIWVNKKLHYRREHSAIVVSIWFTW